MLLCSCEDILCGGSVGNNRRKYDVESRTNAKAQSPAGCWNGIGAADAAVGGSREGIKTLLAEQVISRGCGTNRRLYVLTL